ncbi:hypothetical protein Golomagni_07155, partial [Golovinomyces magnicellulatus]
MADKQSFDSEEIALRMAESCEGQFLWLKLQEESLEDVSNKTDLERIFSAISADITFVYERSYRGIMDSPSQRKSRALSILRWVSFSLRPLLVNELTVALLVTAAADTFPIQKLPDTLDDAYATQSIVRICKGLVEVRGSDTSTPAALRTVQLPHFTVKEYLAQIVAEEKRDSFSLQQHRELAIICIRYLNYPSTWAEVPSQNESASLVQSFRRYAANSWYQHVEQCDAEDSELANVLNYFFSKSNTAWEAWERWFFTSESDYQHKVKGPHGSRLHYVCRFNMLSTLRHVMAEGVSDIDLALDNGVTALLLACERGFASIADILLDAGADATLETDTGTSAFSAAVTFGYYDIVQSILKRQSDKVKGLFGILLPRASRLGHVQIVKLLIKSGAKVSAQDAEGYTPINAACIGAQLRIVELLLQNDSDFKTSNEKGMAPLASACEGGSLEIIQLLVERGADVNSRTNDDWSPVNIAAAMGHFEIVRFLIQK